MLTLSVITIKWVYQGSFSAEKESKPKWKVGKNITMSWKILKHLLRRNYRIGQDFVVLCLLLCFSTTNSFFHITHDDPLVMWKNMKIFISAAFKPQHGIWKCQILTSILHWMNRLKPAQRLYQFSRVCDYPVQCKFMP